MAHHDHPLWLGWIDVAHRHPGVGMGRINLARGLFHHLGIGFWRRRIE